MYDMSTETNENGHKSAEVTSPNSYCIQVDSEAELRNIVFTRLLDVYRCQQGHLPTKAIYQRPAKSQVVFGDPSGLHRTVFLGLLSKHGRSQETCANKTVRDTRGSFGFFRSDHANLLQQWRERLCANQSTRHGGKR